MQTSKDSTIEPDAPTWPEDSEKELAAADYVSTGPLQKYKEAIEKHRLLAEALEAGLDIDPHKVAEVAEVAATILEGLVKTYRFQAIQNGSITDRYDLPGTIRNATGDETQGREF